MSDDFSIFDKRMRAPAVISVAAGGILTILAGISAGVGQPEGPSWLYMIPFGLLAALFLFFVTYRNLSKQYGEA